MLNHDTIIELLGELQKRSNKAAVGKAPQKLNREQSLLLGKDRSILRYVKIAISAISDKLEIERITYNDAQIDSAIEQWLSKNNFAVLQKDVYRALVRDGLTYVLVIVAGNRFGQGVVKS